MITRGWVIFGPRGILWTGLAQTLTDPVLLYRLIRSWIVCLEQPKWCEISFTVNPALSTPITWFLGSFEWRALTKMEAFCNNKLTFYCQYSAANVFLSVLKLLVNHLFLSTCNVRNTFFRRWRLNRPGIWIKIA